MGLFCISNYFISPLLFFLHRPILSHFLGCCLRHVANYCSQNMLQFVALKSNWTQTPVCPNRTIILPPSKMMNFHQYTPRLPTRSFRHHTSLLIHIRPTVDLNHKPCSHFFVPSPLSVITQTQNGFWTSVQDFKFISFKTRLIIFIVT